MKNSLYSLQLQGIQRGTDGFSLIEVLVALVIISLSLLGVAGMQAISIANTGESGYRGIAATQAASMAATMSVNQEYWQTSAVPPVATVTGGVVKFAGVTQTVTNCTSANSGGPCSATQMAVYDLALWGAQLNTALPSATGTITCAFSAEEICTIVVQWYEKNMVQNQQSGTSLAATSTSADLTLMVQP